MARRSTPLKPAPSSTESDGSIVFSVAMCAGPACSIGERLTSGSSLSRQASTSGSSGNYYAPSVDAIRVTVRRGDVVEAVHRVHVATTDGERWGEELRFFLRSSAKPIQAIPFVEGYDDLDDEEIAIACASHHAEPGQLAAARKVLARAGATVDDLENGLQEGRPEGKLVTTARASTRGCSPPVRRTGGRSTRIATRRIRCNGGSPS